jgi:hypothetical protein
MIFDTSEKLCEHVADSSNGVCLLAFSTGKDSIGAYIQLRRYFDKIVPFYLYSVPGLDFVESSLEYYEDIIKERIIRLPHPSFYRWLNNFVFQAPQNCRVIEELRLPDFDYQDIQRVIIEDYNLPFDLLAASGVRQYDSLNRWTAVNRYGALNESKQTFYPIFDWKKDRLLSEIAASGIQLPVDYLMFGRSFDGLDYRFLEPIRKHFPADYDRILEFFPLADLEIARMQFRRHYTNE